MFLDIFIWNRYHQINLLIEIYRMVQSKNRKVVKNIFFEQLFDFSKSHFLFFVSFWCFLEISFKSNDIIIYFALKTFVRAKYELKRASFRSIVNKSCENTLFGITAESLSLSLSLTLSKIVSLRCGSLVDFIMSNKFSRCHIILHHESRPKSRHPASIFSKVDVVIASNVRRWFLFVCVCFVCMCAVFVDMNRHSSVNC